MALKGLVFIYPLISISECILLEASPSGQPEDLRTQSWKEAPRPFGLSLHQKLWAFYFKFYFCLHFLLCRRKQGHGCLCGIQMSAPLRGLFLPREVTLRSLWVLGILYLPPSSKAPSPCSARSVWRLKQHVLQSAQGLLHLQMWFVQGSVAWDLWRALRHQTNRPQMLTSEIHLSSESVLIQVALGRTLHFGLN